MARKITTPKGQTVLASFLSAKKRSPPPRITSPTNQTSSPDNKKAAVTEKLTPEVKSNEPSPSLVSPQRDKPKTPAAVEDSDGDVVMKEKEIPENESSTDKQEEEKENDAIETQQPNEEDVDIPKDSEVPNDSQVEPPRDPSPPITTGNQKPPSILKGTSTYKTYKEAAKDAAHLPEPAPIIPKWEAHRFACMFDIRMPKDKSKRTEYLSTEMNKMLDCLKEYTKVYVRKYSDFHMPRDSDKKSWIAKFDKKKVSDLTAYTFGFYYYQALRDGTFRLLVQLILPVGTNIPELLINANGHRWAGKNNRSIRDIREQNLHSPKYVGWLFRSNYAMVGSSDLQNAFEERAGIHFGLTFKSVPLGNQEAYNKDTAIKAICISCNEDDQESAWNTLMQWYNSKTPKFPLGIPMMFIPSKDHPDIKNNPAAAQNISTLLDRQRIFLRDTDTVSCTHLAFPDEKVKGSRTLRHELMDLTARTMGEEYLGAKLFHAITRKVDPKGGEVYQLTFHKTVAREALSIISGMGQFIKKELRLDAEYYCHPHLINDEHNWDKEKRCVINPTTNYISNLALLAGPGDNAEDQDDGYSMDSKGKRESKRITGQTDEETIKELTKKKTRKKAIPQDVEDDKSVHSEISDLTKFSSSTKASQERKKLRSQLDDQQEELDAKDSEIMELRAALAKQKLKGASMDRSNHSDNNSGENTSESPTQTNEHNEEANHEEDGWEFDDNYSDPQEQEEEEVNLVKVKPPPEKKKDRQDGLMMVFRGSPQQITAVAAHYKEQGVTTIQTLPYKQGTVTKVDLYKVIDHDKFKAAQASESHNVQFADTTKVQEYDTNEGTLSQTPGTIKMPVASKDVTDENSVSESSSSSESSSQAQSSESEASASDSSAESNSSSGSSASTTSSGYKQKNRESTENKPAQEKSKRPSSLTQDTLNQAKEIVDAPIMENTAGDGPNLDV